MDNFIWLFGENLGATSNNNSYYFWKQIVLKKDGIAKYFIMQKNKANLLRYKTLSRDEKKYIIWRNSVKHFVLYFKADMFFVSLSYMDITPTNLGSYKVHFLVLKPLVYLQHGTLGIKAIEYNGSSYNNNMFRFVYYNKNIKQSLLEYNKFKEYQLFFGEYQPRYKELVIQSEKYMSKKHKGKRILWFLTWREYLGKDYRTDLLIRQIVGVLSNKSLWDYLENTSSVLTVCLHQFFDEEKITAFKEHINTDKITFVHSNKTDVLNALAKSDVLITDYSSVGFDFTFLNKPVILYQPDRDAYLSSRNLYCTVDELKGNSFSKARQLVDCIVNEKYHINDFFSSRLPKDIDYDYVKRGAHIEKMYEQFSDIQKNKVTFIGYNFYGVGGTVFATRSLAEVLLEQNYLVELLSLKSTCKPREMPCGLQLSTLYHSNSRRKLERIKRGLFRWQGLYGNLSYDCSKDRLSPYAGMSMKRVLNTIKSRTVISTRESLHLFLNEATSKYIQNKIYFFHCTAQIVNELFPNIIQAMEKIDIPKAVFVSEENRQLYLDKFNFKNYKDYLVLGNTLESSRTVERNNIEIPIEHKEFFGMYLLRISKERKKDIDNLFGFAQYLKDNGIKGIQIDVYGNGDYLDEFLNRLYENEYEDYICYCGETANPKNEMYAHDAVVDFTLNHSFGMPYIEAILNGKMLYCTENLASKEVLSGINGCIYSSYKDLVEKIHSFSDVTIEQLKSNYDKINSLYSRKVLAEKFVGFLNK